MNVFVVSFAVLAFPCLNCAAAFDLQIKICLTHDKVIGKRFMCSYFTSLHSHNPFHNSVRKLCRFSAFSQRIIVIKATECSPTPPKSRISLDDAVRIALKSGVWPNGGDTEKSSWPYLSLDFAETDILSVDDKVEYRDGALLELRGASTYSTATAAWRTQLLDECPDAQCSLERVRELRCCENVSVATVPPRKDMRGNAARAPPPPIFHLQLD